MLKAAMALALITGGSIGCCSAATRLLTDPEKRLIIAVYGANLKDPQSAQYQWAPLVTDAPVKGDQTGYCFRVNAKNSYGGYIGFKTIAGLVKRSAGRIVSYTYTSGGRDDAIISQATEELCQIVGYTF